MDFMDGEIGSISNGCAHKDKDAIDDLMHLNEKMIDNFCHERSVHLAVTLFFALMTVVWFTATLALIVIGPVEYMHAYMVILLGVLTALFMVVDGFYIKHYYYLENSIQKLYKYNADIYRLKTKE